MDIWISIGVYALVEIVLETVSWGTIGYFLFRLFGVKEKHWYLDCLLVTSLLIAWTFWTGTLLASFDISIGNAEVLEFFDDDISGLFETGWFDALLCAIEVFFGYMIGRWWLRRLRSNA